MFTIIKSFILAPEISLINKDLMMPHYLGLNLCYSRKPLIDGEATSIADVGTKMLFDIRYEVFESCRLKKSRYHEAKHNAVYDMTTKAYKSRVMA
jgi:hypothetical protein